MSNCGCGTDGKEKRSTYMKKYRVKRKLDKDARESNKIACNKKKKQEYMKQYMKQYRAAKASVEKKEEHDKYKKNYRAMIARQKKRLGISYCEVP